MNAKNQLEHMNKNIYIYIKNIKTAGECLKALLLLASIWQFTKRHGLHRRQCRVFWRT